MGSQHLPETEHPHSPFHPKTHLEGNVSEIIADRHSTRVFLSKPVPQEVLEESFDLAQRSASNSNVQPWRVSVVRGEPLKKLSKALLKAVNDEKKAQIEPLPEKYTHYRSAMGHSLYGKDGYNIPRGEKEAMETARRRNYHFFDAPVGMIVCMDSALATVDVLSIGLYLQNLVLLLQERGVSSCVQVSVAGYPEEIKEELGLPDHYQVLCGLAVGYEDTENQVNKLRITRDAWKANVQFYDD